MLRGKAGSSASTLKAWFGDFFYLAGMVAGMRQATEWKSLGEFLQCRAQPRLHRGLVSSVCCACFDPFLFAEAGNCPEFPALGEGVLGMRAGEFLSQAAAPTCKLECCVPDLQKHAFAEESGHGQLA